MERRTERVEYDGHGTKVLRFFVDPGLSLGLTVSPDGRVKALLSIVDTRLATGRRADPLCKKMVENGQI